MVMHARAGALDEQESRRRAGAIQLVLTDCDGVLTDAGVYYSANGEEMRRFSVRDGMGVERLRERGITTAIVTRESSAMISRRADKLGILAHVGVRDKAAFVREMAASRGLDRLALMGDDVNDLDAMILVAERGLVAAPADAVLEVARVAHFTAPSRGGHGAFRDFAEWLIAHLAAP
jgi:3-deoxy-D-manno-octulosonate 8-phosphate phosphatase (KDO 8-P phosphatase)